MKTAAVEFALERWDVFDRTKYAMADTEHALGCVISEWTELRRAHRSRVDSRALADAAGLLERVALELAAAAQKVQQAAGGEG